MPERATAAPEVAPKSRPEGAPARLEADVASPAESVALLAGIGSTDRAAPAVAAAGVVVPASGRAVRLSRPGMLALQRTAGNRAVANLVASRRAAPVIQREPQAEIKPAASGDEVQKAIDDKDKGKLKGFDTFPKLSYAQLSAIVDIILDTYVVGPFDIRTLEAAWRAYGPADPGNMTDADIALWKKVTSDRGAGLEVNPKNVPWIAEMRSTFAEDARAMAYDNLQANEDYLKKEAKELGIQLPGEPAPPAETAIPESTYEQRIEQRQKAAKDILRMKDARDSLRKLEVGYSIPIGGSPVKPGTAMTLGMPRVTFNPEAEPAQPPLGNEEKPMPNWTEVKVVWDQLDAGIERRANASAGVFSMLAGGKLGDFENADPAEAKKQLTENLTGSLEGVHKTHERLTPPSPSLGFENLMPVHERLFTGGGKPLWTKAFPQAMAKQYIQDENGNEQKLSAVMGVAALILTVVSFGTGAAAVAALATIVGATASATAAAGSIQKMTALQGAADAGTRTDLSLVNQAQVEEAQSEAIINTALAFVDLYGLGKGIRALATAGVAGMRAAEEARQLAKLKSLAPGEQAIAVASVIDKEGVAAVVSRTGKSPEDLIVLVGKDTPAGKKLSSYLELVAKGGPEAIKDVVPRLGRIAELTAAEAEAAVAQGMELLGPARTLELSGGFSKLQKAVGLESPTMVRMRAWRDAIKDDLATFMTERQAGSAATGTGKDVASVASPQVSSAAQRAEDVQAARSFAASRAGITPAQVDPLLEIPLADPDQLLAFMVKAHPISSATFAALPAAQKAERLVAIINERLAELGLPPAKPLLGLKVHPEFSWSQWELSIPKDVLEKTVWSDAEIRALKESVLHEAVHAEQGYTAARAMAGEGKDVAWIEKKMGLPKDVADRAFANPLKSDAPGYGRAVELFDSVWGARSDWRATVYKWLDTSEAEMLKARQQYRAAIDDLNALPAGQRNPTRALALEARATSLESEYKDWYQAYKDLPEEREAWAAQAALAKKLEEQDAAMKQLADELRAAAPETARKPDVGIPPSPTTQPMPGAPPPPSPNTQRMPGAPPLPGQ